MRSIYSGRRPATLIVVASLAIAAALAGSAAFRKRNAEDRGRRSAVRFESYVLALSWAPSFCAQGGSNRSDRECDPRRHTGFIVHGLWPQSEEGRPLEFCKTVPPVSHAIVEDMLLLMPDRSLIQHEWRAHGSCSGLSPGDYFATVKRAYAKVKIPEEFETRGRPLSAKPADVERLFQAAGGFPDPSPVRTACKRDELTEIRVCFSRDLNPIPCRDHVRECPVPTVLVPPIP